MPCMMWLWSECISGNRGLLLQQRQQYLTQEKLATIAAGRYDFTLSCLSLALRDIAESEGDAG